MTEALSTPHTSQELLRNLRSALEQQLFLQLPFYEETNLKTFFNAKQVKWRTPRLLGGLHAELGEKTELFPGVDITVERGRYFEDLAEPGMAVAHERICAHIHLDLNLRTLRIEAETVKSVFGADGKVSKISVRDPVTRTPFPIAATLIRYGDSEERVAGRGYESAKFTVYGDGTIGEIDIVQEAVR
jgi:hypothetical protein